VAWVSTYLAKAYHAIIRSVIVYYFTHVLYSGCHLGWGVVGEEAGVGAGIDGFEFRGCSAGDRGVEIVVCVG
jgi:hypothetical protein